MTDLDPPPETVRIQRRGPVSWLDLRALYETGALAAISATSDNRSPRREVLAALDMAQGPQPCAFADYSAQTGDVWLDYVADLGDGFDATHSVAWLIGRDQIGLGAVGQPFSQPLPPSAMHECNPKDFGAAQHLLPAGQITIFGGDLVYPFGSQSAYEDRTIGPYRAARPWSLTPSGHDNPRHLFTIPGNHDWYDGLGAYVQRFCQPGRWMGCWQTRQRRSYFALKLPHRVWIWGLDLATADNFDAPQLDYFTQMERAMAPDDRLILCVPKPAWVGRPARQGQTEAEPGRSWNAWDKIETIRAMVDGKAAAPGTSRIAAILSGDLHHYAHYQTAKDDGAPLHLVTCGGGGAFLLGTKSLPQAVEVGDDRQAKLGATFPTAVESRALVPGVFNILRKHWHLCSLLGLGLLLLIWFLETTGPLSLLGAYLGSAGSGPGFGRALSALLMSSPVPILLLGAIGLGFVLFAGSGAEGARGRAFLAGTLHLIVHLTMAFLVTAHFLVPILPAGRGPLLLIVFVLFALFLGWLFAGIVFATYLYAANAALGLHEQEVFSAQAIEDWKCFLRIHVGAGGITIYPIGLRHACHDWTPADAPPPAPPPSARPMDRARDIARGLASRLAGTEDVFEVPRGMTHLYRPAKPLAPHLIEAPIHLQRKGPLV